MRFSTYSMSYLIHSWKSAPRLRVRWICQRPVIPGRTLSLASRQGGQILILLARAGPRAHDGHVAEQHVDELRQLVEIIFPQHLADRREARVLLHVKLRAVCLVLRLKLRLELLGILAHRTELDAREFPAAHRLALVGEEHRPAIVQPDRQHDDRDKSKGSAAARPRLKAMSKARLNARFRAVGVFDGSLLGNIARLDGEPLNFFRRAAGIRGRPR